MEFGDLEEQRRTRKSRKRGNTDANRIDEEDDSEEELSLAAIELHLEKQ